MQALATQPYNLNVSISSTQQALKSNSRNPPSPNADPNSDRIPTHFEWVENKTIGFNSTTALQARLLSDYNVPLENKIVEFYMLTDSGIDYYLGSNVTNSFGIAEFTPQNWAYFHDGEHLYHVEFKGDNIYKNTSTSAVITIVHNWWFSNPVLYASANTAEIDEKHLSVSFQAFTTAPLGWHDFLHHIEYEFYYQIVVDWWKFFGEEGRIIKELEKFPANGPGIYDLTHAGWEAFGNISYTHPYDIGDPAILRGASDSIHNLIFNGFFIDSAVIETRCRMTLFDTFTFPLTEPPAHIDIPLYSTAFPYTPPGMSYTNVSILKDDDFDAPFGIGPIEGDRLWPVIEKDGIDLEWRYSDLNGFDMDVDVFFENPGGEKTKYNPENRAHTFSWGQSGHLPKSQSFIIPQSAYQDKVGYKLLVNWTATDRDDKNPSSKSSQEIQWCKFVQLEEPFVALRDFFHNPDSQNITMVGSISLPLYADEPHKFSFKIYNPNDNPLTINQVTIEPVLEGHVFSPMFYNLFSAGTILEVDPNSSTRLLFSDDFTDFPFRIPKSLITGDYLRITFRISIEWEMFDPSTQTHFSGLNATDREAIYRNLETPIIRYHLGFGDWSTQIGGTEEVAFKMKTDYPVGLLNWVRFTIEIYNPNLRFPLFMKFQSSEVAGIDRDRTDLKSLTGSAEQEITVQPGEVDYVYLLLECKDPAVFNMFEEIVWTGVEIGIDALLQYFTGSKFERKHWFWVAQVISLGKDVAGIQVKDLVENLQLFEAVCQGLDLTSKNIHSLVILDSYYLDTGMNLGNEVVTTPELPVINIYTIPSATQMGTIQLYFTLKQVADGFSIFGGVTGIIAALIPDPTAISKGILGVISSGAFFTSIGLKVGASVVAHICNTIDPPTEWKEGVTPQFLDHTFFDWSVLTEIVDTSETQRLIAQTQRIFDSIGHLIGNLDGFATALNRRNSAMAALEDDSEAQDWAETHTLSMIQFSEDIANDVNSLFDEITLWQEDTKKVVEQYHGYITEEDVDDAVTELAGSTYPEESDSFILEFTNYCSQTHFGISQEDFTDDFEVFVDAEEIFDVEEVVNVTTNIKPVSETIQITYEDIALSLAEELTESFEEIDTPLPVNQEDISNLENLYNQFLATFDANDYRSAHSFALQEYYLAVELLVTTRNTTILDPFITQANDALETIRELREIELGNNLPEIYPVVVESGVQAIDLPIIVYNKGPADNFLVSISNLPINWISQSIELEVSDFESTVLHLTVQGPIDLVQGIYSLIIQVESTTDSTVFEQIPIDVQVDDDLTAPEITIIHAGAYPGCWQVSFTDPEHPDTITAEYQIDGGPLTSIIDTTLPFVIEIPLVLGVHELIVYSENNDDEFIGDEELAVTHTFFVVEHIPPWWNPIEDRYLSEAGAWSQAVNLWAYASDDKRSPDEMVYEITFISVPAISAVIENNHYVNLAVIEPEWLGTCIINVTVNDGMFITETSFLVIVSDDDIIPPALSISVINCVSDGQPGQWRILVEDSSGLSEIHLTIDGHEFIYTQADFGSDSLIEFFIPVNNELGMHTCSGLAMDADLDRGLVDSLSVSHAVASCTIMDDDAEPPIVGIIIGDPFWSGEKIVLPFTIYAFDESGIALILVMIGPHVLYLDVGYHEVILDPGLYTMETWIMDADQDRPDDSLATHLTIPGIIVDLLPPTTTLEKIGTLGLNDWFVSSVMVHLSAVDDVTGVALIEYSYDGSNWVPYSSPFEIAAEGITLVYYRSTDNNGNVEPTKIEAIMIDKTPPTTSLDIGVHYIEGEFIYVTSETEFTLNALDETSAIAYTYYQVSGGDWIEYTGPFVLTGVAGTYTLEWYSVDIVGNVEGISSETVELVKLDVTSYLTDSEFSQILFFDFIVHFDKKSDLYKLVATNPGQFYYNIEITNNWPISVETLVIDALIPDDFVLKGGTSIHVYLDGEDVTHLCLISDTTITFSNLPVGSQLYVAIHLDYGLKKQYFETLAEIQMQNYVFDVCMNGESGNPSPGEELQGNYNTPANLIGHQKKVTAIAGYVYDASGLPVIGATIELHDAQGLIASTTTDENGFYYFFDIDDGEYSILVHLDDQVHMFAVIATNQELTLAIFNLE